MNRHLAVELLSSYLDEEVTPTQLRLVEAHLGDCSDCRHRLAGLRAVATGVRRLEAVAPPQALSAAVERRVRLASREEPGRFSFEEGLRRWTGQPVLAPAFAVILALGSIVYLFAFGVSKSARNTTRVVVASVPSEGEADSLERSSDFQIEEIPVASRGELDELVAAQEPGKSEEARPSVRSASGPSSSAARVGASVKEDFDDGAAGLHREMKARLDSVSPDVEAEAANEPAQVAEVGRSAQSAFESATEAPSAGPAPPSQPRERRLVAKASRVVATPEVADEVAFTDAAAGIREISGRRFVRADGMWVEAGLAGESAVEVLDLRTEPSRLGDELETFRELEHVRLRVGERIVEVIYSASGSRN